MSNVKLITSNAIDGMTLNSHPSAVAALPINNVKNSLRARIARMIGSRFSIYGEGLNEIVDGFAIAHHNLSADATVRLRIYAGERQGGGVVYDSGHTTLSRLIPWGSLAFGIDPWGGIIPSRDLPSTFALWFDAVSGLSFRCDIRAPGNQHIDIGRLFIGKSFSPRHNYSYGGGLSWVEQATQTRTEGGSLMVEAAMRYRRLKLKLDWLDEGDRDALSRLLRRHGKAGDMLITLNPERVDAIGLEETLLCRRVNDFDLLKTQKRYTRLQLILEEV